MVVIEPNVPAVNETDWIADKSDEPDEFSVFVNNGIVNGRKSAWSFDGGFDGRINSGVREVFEEFEFSFRRVVLDFFDRSGNKFSVSSLV